MQVNESKMAFICFHLFFRIWTFQLVTRDSNKKFPPPCPRLWYNLGSAPQHASPDAGLNPADGDCSSTDSEFRQDIARFPKIAASGSAPPPSREERGGSLIH
jgi:hypothetical protein